MLVSGDPIQVLDVRREAEFDAGHIANANLIPLGKMAALLNGDSQSVSNGLLARLDASRPVAVHCKGGYRSAIATSLLERAGHKAVANILGGFDAWEAQKLPSVTEGADSGTTAATTRAAIGPSR